MSPSIPPITCADELRARIRALGETEPDPTRIAEKIVASLSDAEAHVIAEAALGQFVRLTVSHGYSAAPREYETSTGQRTASRKVAAVRDWVAAELNRSVYVRGNDEWKHLRDCSADDLAEAVASRHDKVADLQAQIAWLDQLRAEVVSAGVDAVGELDRAVLEAVLRR